MDASITSIQSNSTTTGNGVNGGSFTSSTIRPLFGSGIFSRHQHAANHQQQQQQNGVSSGGGSPAGSGPGGNTTHSSGGNSSCSVNIPAGSNAGTFPAPSPSLGPLPTPATNPLPPQLLAVKKGGGRSPKEMLWMVTLLFAMAVLVTFMGKFPSPTTPPPTTLQSSGNTNLPSLLDLEDADIDGEHDVELLRTAVKRLIKMNRKLRYKLSVAEQNPPLQSGAFPPVDIYNAPGKTITDLAATFQSPPVTDKISVHKYELLYEKYLSPLRGRKNIKILEIGIGCGMGNGPGRGFELFSKYLPDAQYAAIELGRIDLKCKRKLHRIGQMSKRERIIHGYANLETPEISNLLNHTVWGDQTSKTVMDKAIKLFGPFDVIIDDGAHYAKVTLETFQYLFLEGLKPGGAYIVEDLQVSTHANWGGTKDAQLQHQTFVTFLNDLMIMQHHEFWNRELDVRNYILNTRTYPEITAWTQTIECAREICAVTKNHAEFDPALAHRRALRLGSGGVFEGRPPQQLQKSSSVMSTPSAVSIDNEKKGDQALQSNNGYGGPSQVVVVDAEQQTQTHQDGQQQVIAAAAAPLVGDSGARSTGNSEQEEPQVTDQSTKSSSSKHNAAVTVKQQQTSSNENSNDRRTNRQKQPHQNNHMENHKQRRMVEFLRQQEHQGMSPRHRRRSQADYDF